MGYELKTVQGCERKIIRLERSVMNCRDILRNKAKELTPQQGMRLIRLVRQIEGEELPALRARMTELGQLPNGHIMVSELFKGFM